MDIQLQEFFKVFGDQGTVFVVAEDKEIVDFLYPGSEVSKKKKVRGYGIPLSNGLWEVYDDAEDAKAFYRRTMGGITSGALVMEDYGVRERVEL
jgi:hypothetical protein